MICKRGLLRQGVFGARFMPSVMVAVVFLNCVACSDFKRIGGIQNSTERTEKTAEELNGNTKQLKTSVENVEADAKLMKLQLELALRQLELANKALLQTNTTLGSLIGIWGKAAENIEDLVKNTWLTYVDLRKGNTQSLRADQLKLMESADTLSGKSVEAFKYFLSFEFQLWRPDSGEAVEARAKLVDEGALEFASTFTNYLPASRKDYSLSPVGEGQMQQNLLALALTLNASNCAALPADAALPICSVEEMLLSGLGTAHEEGADLQNIVPDALKTGEVRNTILPFQKTVLEVAHQAEHLLMLRVNALPAIVLNSLTSIPGESGWLRNIKLLRLTAGAWQADTLELNLSQLEKLVDLLEQTRNLKQKLGEIGIALRFDEMVQKATSNAVFGEIDLIERIALRNAPATLRLGALKRLKELFLSSML